MGGQQPALPSLGCAHHLCQWPDSDCTVSTPCRSIYFTNCSINIGVNIKIISDVYLLPTSPHPASSGGAVTACVHDLLVLFHAKTALLLDVTRSQLICQSVYMCICALLSQGLFLCLLSSAYYGGLITHHLLPSASFSYPSPCPGDPNATPTLGQPPSPPSTPSLPTTPSPPPQLLGPPPTPSSLPLLPPQLHPLLPSCRPRAY